MVRSAFLFSMVIKNQPNYNLTDSKAEKRCCALC